jgi:hypothetical protein
MTSPKNCTSLKSHTHTPHLATSTPTLQSSYLPHPEPLFILEVLRNWLSLEGTSHCPGKSSDPALLIPEPIACPFLVSKETWLCRKRKVKMVVACFSGPEPKSGRRDRPEGPINASVRNCGLMYHMRLRRPSVLSHTHTHTHTHTHKGLSSNGCPPPQWYFLEWTVLPLLPSVVLPRAELFSLTWWSKQEIAGTHGPFQSGLQRQWEGKIKTKPWLHFCYSLEHGESLKLKFTSPQCPTIGKGSIIKCLLCAGNCSHCASLGNVE